MQLIRHYLVATTATEGVSYTNGKSDTPGRGLDSGKGRGWAAGVGVDAMEFSQLRYFDEPIDEPDTVTETQTIGAAKASRRISPASPAAVGLMFLLNEVAGFALASITWDRAEKMVEGLCLVPTCQ